MPLWLITVPVLAPPYVLMTGTTDIDETYLNIAFFSTCYNRAFTFILLYEIILRKRRIAANLFPIIISYAILVVYLLCHNLIFGSDFFVAYQDVMGNFYYLPLMILLVINEKARPKLKHVYFTVILSPSKLS